MRTVEEGEVRFGGTPIPYQVTRSRRRKKTVAISVKAGGEVQVKAPHNTTAADIAHIVSQKARWIVQHQRRLEELPPGPGPRQFVSGETYLYLGRQYRLRITSEAAGGGGEKVRLLGGWFVVPLSRDLAQEDRPAYIRTHLTDWYRIQAHARLPERVDEYAPLIGVRPRAVLIREARARWGSCDAKGILRFNWRIIQAPRRVIDYVVAHELAHIVHPNHGRDFWTLLGKVMPDYEARRESLRQIGRQLVW